MTDSGTVSFVRSLILSGLSFIAPKWTNSLLMPLGNKTNAPRMGTFGEDNSGEMDYYDEREGRMKI